MRFELLPLAANLVRAWTRVYTRGLPPADRTARLAEIASDLWEFEHDPDAPRDGRAAMNVLARLLTGIPDDLAWRMDVGVAAHGAPVSVLAAAGVMTASRRISAFGLAATIHVAAISAVMALASRGPLPLTILGRAMPDGAGIQRRLSPDESFWNPNISFWNQRFGHERRNPPVAKMHGQSVQTPVKS